MSTNKKFIEDGGIRIESQEKSSSDAYSGNTPASSDPENVKDNLNSQVNMDSSEQKLDQTDDLNETSEESKVKNSNINTHELLKSERKIEHSKVADNYSVTTQK